MQSDVLKIVAIDVTTNLRTFAVIICRVDY